VCEHCYWIAQITFHIVHCVISHKSVMCTTDPLTPSTVPGPKGTRLISATWLHFWSFVSNFVRILCRPHHFNPGTFTNVNDNFEKLCLIRIEFLGLAWNPKWTNIFTELKVIPPPKSVGGLFLLLLNAVCT
jgi:hypothetical protein